MRRLLLMLICAALAASAYAQGNDVAAPSVPTSAEGWAQRVARFGTVIPQEKVYLHTDNTAYYLGDTIWYAAYTRRTDRALPSDVSRVLYVELLNHDGYLVERQLVRMTDGHGHGNIVLPDTLYGGYYELRAYTRWQLNWGAFEHAHQAAAERWFFNRQAAREYYRDYSQLYSRVFPVYDKPAAPGEFFPDMTLRPLRRSYADPDTSQLHLSLFPEGGSLVAGVECRMAYEVTDGNGRYVDGSLTLSKSHAKVATAPVQHRGRGSLTFTPEEGSRYVATFTAADGRTVTLPTPAPLSEGAALTLQTGCTYWTITLHPHFHNPAPPLGLTLMHEGRLVHLWTPPSDSVTTITLRADTLEAGVHQLTLFDASGRVHADRLAFAFTPQLSLRNLRVEGLQPSYEPHAPVQFQIVADSAALTDGSRASVSVSVRDADAAEPTFDSADILAEMLLCSELRGFIPSPHDYFQAADEHHLAALDLLMLTQGWRRFVWHDMATPGAFAIRHPAEYTQVLQGVVMPYEARVRTDSLQQVVMAEHEAFHTSFPASDPFDDSSSDASTEGSVSVDPAADAAASGLMSSQQQQGDASADARLASATEGSRGENLQGTRLRRDVLVHAEFVQPGYEPLVGDMTTTRGRFQIQVPEFDTYCLFYLAASDTTRWRPAHPHTWISMDEDDYPEFYVRLSWPYPRFAHPYNYYHTAERPRSSRRQSAIAEQGGEGEAADVGTTIGTSLESSLKVLPTVSVTARRRGLRRFDASKPAFIIDAYDAFNEVADAGLLIPWYDGQPSFVAAVARAYVGDMGLPNAYKVEARMEGHNSSYSFTAAQHNAYNRLSNLETVRLYSDYSPRREGDDVYAKDRPTVSVDLRRMPNEGQRVTYRDRRYVLRGFNVPDDFYHPDYSVRQPPAPSNDYRRTLYWNPDLDLTSGQATITLYNNSRRTSVIVSAQGQASNGTLLTTGETP